MAERSSVEREEGVDTLLWMVLVPVITNNCKHFWVKFKSGCKSALQGSPLPGKTDEPENHLLFKNH
jgi:hypothetical protein